MVVVGDGLGVEPEVLPGDAAHFPGVGQIGIAVESFCGVGLGAAKIVEIELGDGSEKIGLGQIGLGRDGLIEILYRQNVVFEPHRVLPDADNLIDVDLPLCQTGHRAEDQNQ